MRCLILGASGFIGRHLAQALLSQGHQLTCMNRGENPWPSNPQVRFVPGDIRCEDDLDAALYECEACFHLVSTTDPRTSNLDPIQDVESNLIPSIRLVQIAQEHKLQRLVFVSSGGTVYGRPEQVPIPETHPTNPSCSYGIVKLAIEKYLGLFQHLNGLRTVILRLANPFGEGQRANTGQGAVAAFLARAIGNESIEIWGDGSIVRDYLHIDDAVSAMVAALTYEGGERIFNIGSGRGRSVNEVLSAIEHCLDTEVRRHYLPGRPFDVPTNVLDISRARRELNWTPRVDFVIGVRRLADWLKQQPG